MKNRFFAALMAAMLLVSLLAVGANAETTPGGRTLGLTATLTEDEAVTIALTHAGVEEKDVIFTKIKLDRDDGRTEYEIEFYKDTMEYDYEIDANTGEILSFDSEMEYDLSAARLVGTANADPNAQMIDMSAALANALAHAGFNESEVTKLKVKLDRDDGMVEYEVDFQVGRLEYEYQINAYTGEITGFEVDND